MVDGKRHVRAFKRQARARSSRSSTGPAPIVLSLAVLKKYLPLPQPCEGGDKEERGRVLIIGGSSQMPGAVILAATAALRAGAGKLRIATVKSVAGVVAAAVPESRVFSLPEARDGSIALSAAKEIAERANEVQSVLIGPGMINEKATTRLMSSVLTQIKEATLILDAAALFCLADGPELLHKLKGRAIITPHAEEMSKINGTNKTEATSDALNSARDAASKFRAVVALKGRETFIAGPDGRAFSNRAGNVGLATSGSGDALAGLIAGFAARRSEPINAACWGVHIHALAGERLASRIGPLGYLARELSEEIPMLMLKIIGPEKR